MQISGFSIYSKATSLLGEIEKSLTEARQWSIKLNLNRPGKLIQGQQATAQFDVFSQDPTTGAEEKGQLSAVDIKKMSPLFETIQWARRVNHSYGLRQEIAHAGIVMDAGQATIASGLSISAKSGRVVLPTSESMNIVIDNLELARAALQVFIEEGEKSHEETSLHYQDRRSQYESTASQFNVTVDVFLARLLKNAAPEEILETLAPMEWPLPAILHFILDYRLKGGMELVTDWVAAKPALLKRYDLTESQDIKDAHPLLLEVFQNEVWDEMKIRNRKKVLEVLEELGMDSMPFLDHLIVSFNSLSGVFRQLIDKITNKTEQNPVMESDLEVLDVLWEFAWGDRLYSFLPRLAHLYGQHGKREEACRFLKEWFLTAEEIERWTQISMETGKGGFLRDLGGAPATLLALGDKEPSEEGKSLDELMRDSMVQHLTKKMWALVQTLYEMQDLEGSRDMAHQLLAGRKEDPSSEEIPTTFLIKVGGAPAKEVVHRRLQDSLNELRSRSHRTSDGSDIFASLSDESEQSSLFRTLSEIAEADSSDKAIVKDAFKELLQDKKFYLSPSFYLRAATWLLMAGDEEEKEMAKQFLRQHKNSFSVPSLPRKSSNPEEPDVTSLEKELDHSNPYVRLEAAEKLASACSTSSPDRQSENVLFPWIKITEVLEKLLALPENDGDDYLASLGEIFGANDFKSFSASLSYATRGPQEIRARASRLLDKLKPGWDQEMLQS